MASATQRAIDATVLGSSLADALPVKGAAASTGFHELEGVAVAAATPDAPDEEAEAAATLDAPAEDADAALTEALLAAQEGADTMLVPAPWLTVVKEILGNELLDEAGEGLLVTGITVWVMTGTVVVLEGPLYVYEPVYH